MYYFVHYREDITGICEAQIWGGKFDTLQEASDFRKANTEKFQVENPYFVHLAIQKEDGHFYFLGDESLIHITL